MFKSLWGARAWAADLPIASAGAPLFSHWFLDFIFPPIFLDVGSSMGSIFHHFSTFSASFFEHGFCINVSSILRWILTSLLMVFDDFSCSRMQSSKPSKTFVFQWISMILLFRETWCLMNFLIFSDTSFGIYFWWVLASILAPVWDRFGIKLHVFGWSFLLMILWIDFHCFSFLNFDQKDKFRS